MADTSDTVQRQLDGVYQRALYYVPALDPAHLLTLDPTTGQRPSPASQADYDEGKEDGRRPALWGEANAISSLAHNIVSDGSGKKVHLPCFDVDHPLWVDDQFLFFGGTWPDDTAWAVLEVFKKVGLIQKVGDVRFSEGGEPAFGVGPIAPKVLPVPSSTQGHYHLYIDAPLTSGAYWGLLKALSEVNIVEEGYYKVCKKRGTTFLRLKPNKQECTEAADKVPPKDPDDDDPADFF